MKVNRDNNNRHYLPSFNRRIYGARVHRDEEEEEEEEEEEKLSGLFLHPFFNLWLAYSAASDLRVDAQV